MVVEMEVVETEAVARAATGEAAMAAVQVVGVTEAEEVTVEAIPVGETMVETEEEGGAIVVGTGEGGLEVGGREVGIGAAAVEGTTEVEGATREEVAVGTVVVITEETEVVAAVVAAVVETVVETEAVVGVVTGEEVVGVEEAVDQSTRV